MGESRQNLRPRHLRGNEGIIYWNMLTVNPISGAVGNWVRIVNSNHIYCGYLYNADLSDADNYSVDIFCAKGVYTLRMMYVENTNSGVLDIDVDGVEKGSVDTYAAVATYINVLEITSLSLRAGKHTIRVRVDGKNGSSSAYACITHGFALVRTA